jgi:polyhydroxybutyrate depolymerase
MKTVLMTALFLLTGLAQASEDNATVQRADIPSVAGQTITTEGRNGSTQWVFDANGQVSIKGGTFEAKGSYTQKGKDIDLEINGRPMRATFDGTNLSFARSGENRRRRERDYSVYSKPYEDDCVEHGGYFRCWQIHVPESVSSSQSGQVPLVLDLHGFTSNPTGQRRMSGFEAMADTEEFIVVWPLGMHASWNAGPACCGFSVEDDVDDVGFMRKLVAKVSKSQQVDPKRIYVTGLSNGSAMSQRLANEASDLIAATASMSLYLLVEPDPGYSPIPVMEIHGTDDRVVPYEPRNFPGAMPNFETWKTMNGCSGDSVVSWQSGDSVARTYTECAHGSEVTQVTVAGGGHATYKGMQTDIDTSRLAWDFLSRFSK